MGVKIKFDDEAFRKAFGPLQWDRSKSEAQQVADVTKELKKRGVEPNRAGVLKMVRDANK